MANGEWDVFGWQWGLGLPVRWFDVPALIALLDDTLTTESTIDRLVLGWEGQEHNTMEIVRVLLRSRGYFLGIAADGRLRFARLRPANVTDLDNPTIVAPIPRTLKMQPSEGEGIDRLVGTIGGTPWSDGVPFDVNVQGDSELLNPPNSLRAGLFGKQTSVEFDLSTSSPAEIEDTVSQLISIATFRGFGSPILDLKATDSGAINHGDLVRIGDPGLKKTWFVDADGNSIEVGTDPKWFGQVIGFRRNFDDGSVDLTLIMHNWHHNSFARLRAPSAVVDFVGGSVYAIENNNFGGPDGSGSDADQFTPGDRLELWQADGLRRSGTAAAPDVRTIVSILGDNLTLNAAFTVIGGAGDIIRISNIDSFPDTGNPAKFASLLAYTYAADDAGLLGSNDLAAHTYGFGLT